MRNPMDNSAFALPINGENARERMFNYARAGLLYVCNICML